MPGIRAALPSPGSVLITERDQQERQGMVAGGASDGNIPIIHGLDREYVLLALFQYRLGARDNATMANAIAGLGDEELAALAAYFSAQ